MLLVGSITALGKRSETDCEFGQILSYKGSASIEDNRM